MDEQRFVLTDRVWQRLQGQRLLPNGRYTKNRFIELVGRSTNLPDALAKIARDCPRRKTAGISFDDPCGAAFPELIAYYERRLNEKTSDT